MSMDLWIESHESLGQHWKMKRAARLLGISHPQMVGHLHYLWWWGARFAESGEITSFEPVDIAEAAMWEGDPDLFFEALCSANFLDVDDEGSFFHDWRDYIGKLLEAKRKHADKMKRLRAGQKQPRDEHEPASDQHASNKEPARADHVPGTLPSRNGLTVTVTKPNHNNDLSAIFDEDEAASPREEERPDEAAPKRKTPLKGAEAIATFQRFWDLYPRRNGVRIGRAACEALFAKLPLDEWPILLQGTERYLQICGVNSERSLAKDPEQFLKHGIWRDVLEPATSPIVREVQPERVHSPAVDRFSRPRGPGLARPSPNGVDSS
jgi:hypothetical protein